MDRRSFLAASGAVALASLKAVPAMAQATIPARKLARLSVSSSTYRANYEGRFNVPTATPKLSHRTFPAYVKEKFGITKVELWDQQFGPAGHTFEECRAIRAAADAAGVQVVSVEVEDMARIDAADPDDRAQAVAEGKVWLDKARVLGCSSMRFNVNRGRGEVNQDAAVEVLRKMADHGRELGIIVLLENHGGATSTIPNLIALVKAVNHPFLKAEPDWGAWSPPGDRYAAMKSAMAVTHIVSAKGLVFDPQTYEHTSFDVARLVKDAESTGFKGVYSIELYNNPAPADTDRAVMSYARTITDNMA
ncbi:sugar phosphate isomerase/epimerase family protein [Sphingomonas quercus]|uniref:Sugar phosphate isomerase/epimerase n=1 Tax=Sphingomonas quercus TaxID=2842451 RepID=A0ABS6BL64_9SPHN|nr:TIM barrel protein [Sphingomonas quercus]MBU3079050.1 sugar phosphate isomerase/epimerase [Sphingomonas quercus]